MSLSRNSLKQSLFRTERELRSSREKTEYDFEYTSFDDLSLYGKNPMKRLMEAVGLINDM